MTELTPEQERALALARARRRRAEAEAAGQSPGPSAPSGSAAMADGMRTLSVMSRNPDVMRANVDAADAGRRMAASQAATNAEPSAFGAFAGNLADGLTFGGADELAAGIGSVFEDRTYDEILAGLRKQDQALEEAHPWASMAGEMTGALAPGALMAKGIAAARTLPGMVAQGVKYGAAGGGVQGFLDGEGGFGERLKSAGMSALIGGGIGGLIPVVGAGAKQAWRSAADAWRNSRIGSEVGKSLGTSNTTGRILADLLGADDPAAMRAALDRAGPSAMLADVSPQATGALDMAMRSPIPAAREAGKAVEDRAAAAYGNVAAALDTTMGQPAGLLATQKGIVDASAPARRAAYDAAYAMPIDYSAEAGSRLLDELAPRIPAKAIEYANSLMRTKGEKSAQIMASIADDGTVTFTRPPDVRQWDYIKQGLDMMAESGDGAGAMGGQTRMGSAYQGLAREVRDAVKDATGGEDGPYGRALSIAADTISERKAVEFGSKLLRTTTTPEMARDAIEGATAAEIAAMKKGVRSQIANVLGDVRKVASDQNLDAREVSKAFSDLSSENAQSKMAMLLGDEWPALKTELDRAGAALGLRARTSANSATFGRTAADAAITDAVTPGPLRQGKPLEAAKGLIASALGASPAAIRKARDDVKGELAAILTRQGGGAEAIDTVLSALAANPMNPTSGDPARRLIEALLLGNTGGASSGVLSQLGLQ